ALDRVHLRLFHLLEELPRVGRQRFHVAALTFGIDRVESQRGFAGARQPGDHDKLIARDLEIDVLEIVLAGASDDDAITGHGDSLYIHDSPRIAGPQPRDVLRLARLSYSSPRTAGPQPRDVLRLARLSYGSPRTAGPQPRDVLRLARLSYGSPRTARPQPRD